MSYLKQLSPKYVDFIFFSFVCKYYVLHCFHFLKNNCFYLLIITPRKKVPGLKQCSKLKLKENYKFQTAIKSYLHVHLSGLLLLANQPKIKSGTVVL